MNKPKILVIHAKGGCTFWRTYQPCEEMRKQGLAEIRYIEAQDMTARGVAEDLKWCDLVNIRGLIGVEGLSTMRKYQSLGKPVTVDYDDLHFNVSPFNPAYKNFGMEEVQVKNPATGDVQYLWRDGVDGLDIKANKVKFHSYVQILREADLITVTTVYLKKAMAEISGREDNIKVLPNAIDLTQWKPLDVRDKFKDTFRFGWAVSNSHGEDWLFIKPALKEFLTRHKDAKFVVIGDTSMDITTALPKDQIEWYPFSNLWEYHYSYRMPMLGLDVAIAPLADLEFNRCKSPLKYEEYTAFGWPVIAQDMEPYSSHIIQGNTGLLAKTTEDWVRCLESLYSNVNLRRTIHFNAMFTIRSMFDLHEVAKDWATAYSETISEGAKVIG